MSKILELADAYARETYPSLITEARAALVAEVEKLEQEHIQRLLRIEKEVDVVVAERDALRAESNEMALIGVRTVADVLALGAEIESYRQQLRKEQLYVQTLADELEAARKNEFNPDWDQQKVLLERIQELEKLVVKFHAAKGRYHTQIAACDLFDAVGLKNERPVK